MSKEDLNFQRLQRWERWIEAHQAELEHVVGFEERFVRDILTCIPNLDPEDLIPQYPFFDRNGRRRRVDFMILNESKGYALAIEIDGLSKITEQEDPYGAYTDMLLRQNDLLEKLQCLLLRFSNKAWLHHSDEVILEITHALREQELKHKKIKAQAQKDLDQQTKLKILMQEIDNLKALHASQSNLKHSLSLNDQEHEKLILKIKNLEAEISRLKGKTTKALAQNTSPSEDFLKEAEFTTSKAQTLKQASYFPKKALYLLALIPLFILGLMMWPQESLNIKTQNTKSVTEVPVSATSYNTKESFTPVFSQNSTRNTLSSNISLTQNTPLSQKTYLTPQEALLHLGEIAVVCGTLSEIYFTKKRTFLNFEASFPDNIFSAVIEDEDASHFKGINQHLHQKLCVQGLIRPYAKRALINLKEKKQWLRTL